MKSYKFIDFFFNKVEVISFGKITHSVHKFNVQSGV